MPEEPLDKSLSGWSKFNAVEQIEKSALNSKEKRSHFITLCEFCIDISETRASKVISAHIALLSESRIGNAEAECKAGKKIAPLAGVMAPAAGA